MNSEVWETTEEDAATTQRFLGNLLRGEGHDHFAPLGDLRACVDDPSLAPDDIRQSMAGELWSACEMDSLAAWQQESELGHWNNLGSSSRILPYPVRRPDGGKSLEERFEVYFTPRDLRVNGNAMDYAVEQVSKLWPRSKARLRSLALDDVSGLADKKTNSGFPRCRVSDWDNYYYHYLEANRLAERGFPLAEASSYPCIGTTRSAARLRSVGKGARFGYVLPCSEAT